MGYHEVAAAFVPEEIRTMVPLVSDESLSIPWSGLGSMDRMSSCGAVAHCNSNFAVADLSGL